MSLEDPQLIILPNNSESINRLEGIRPFTLSYTTLSDGYISIQSSNNNIIQLVI